MSGAASKWELEPVQFGWMQIGDLAGETHLSRDGDVDEFERFWQFKGGPSVERRDVGGPIWSSDYYLGVGIIVDGDVVGFLVDKEVSRKQEIVRFHRTDDFPETGELISMIEGGGADGRSGFDLPDQVPNAYTKFRIQPICGRIAGASNALGVVVGSDLSDLPGVLDHIALQVRLRGLS